ncbi:MAG: autotransporter outer membrane beta-barrel domain-containing protein [Methyloligellaceae bacterium]
MKRYLMRVGLAVTLFGSLSAPLDAADFTIQDGETLTTTQTLSTGETGIVEEGGALITHSVKTIELPASATGITIINRGLISNTDDEPAIDGHSTSEFSLTIWGTISSNLHHSIDAGNVTNLTNHGTISANDTKGINIDNLTGDFINTGTIETPYEAVDIENFPGTFLNSGTISSSLGDAIFIDDTISQFTNTGTINGAGWGLDTSSGDIVEGFNSGLIAGGLRGIESTEIMSFVNSGTIRGEAEFGIRMDFGSIENSGLIEGNIGIQADRDTAGDATIINSGTIRSMDGHTGVAIDFQGTGDDLLDLRRGSIIEGQINLGAGTDTLKIDPTLKLHYTFDSLPELLLGVSDNIFATQGTSVMTIGSPGISDTHVIVADLSRGIGSTVAARMSALRQPGSLSLAATSGTQPNYLMGPEESMKDRESAVAYSQSRRQLWAEAFGSTQKKSASAAQMAFSQKTAGIVTGMDAPVHDSLIVGGFLGAGRSYLTTEYYEKSETDSFFGGIYGTLGSSLGSIDLVLTAGWSSLDEENRILNNLAPGGVEYIETDKSSWFIAPEIGVNRNLPGLGLSVSLRGRYIAQFHEDYTQGGAILMQVQERTVQQVFGRAEIARAFASINDLGLTQPVHALWRCRYHPPPRWWQSRRYHPQS